MVVVVLVVQGGARVGMRSYSCRGTTPSRTGARQVLVPPTWW